MTFAKRCFLVVLVFQIGCLALDHSISELEYEEDEFRILVGSNYPTDSIEGLDENEGNTNIIFNPKFYDFNESPVGMPRLGVVRVDNRLKDETLKLISISGNTINFHSSFFADKIIGPGNSTTFEVVFLSREPGPFESVLFVHTSKGLFKYQVKGVGLPNPYRLRPLVGAKIPVNGSYEPIITLHNPHDTRIVVVEMLSSGTDFSLKLPNDTNEGEGAAWAIEPFQTKPVMQGSFRGKTEGNHTGFIRIKVNHTAISGEYLMVPVEVHVSSSPGIYSPQESLDFGLLVRSDKPKTLSLNLINSQRTSITVQSVSVKNEMNPALRIEFRPIAIEPDTSASTVVALITFDPSLMTSAEQSNGYIEVRSECGRSIAIPFQASVLEGELEYNASSLGFSVRADNEPRNFSVRNKFSSAVAIYQVSVNHPDIVQIDSLNQSHIISPGEQKTICTLKVQRKMELCDSKSSIQLTVKSNITNLKLPIKCYDGKLQLYSVEKGHVDFGRVELYSTHTEYIAVQNKNPIEVRLKSWGSNNSWSQVELVGMKKGVMEDLPTIRDFDNLKKSLFLQPDHMAVFSIDIRRPTVEGKFFGESYVTTDQNQTLRMPFRFAVSRGAISSDAIFFDKAFPGKVSSEKLYLSSTYNHTMNLIGLRSYPPSSVWFSASTLSGYAEVVPYKQSFVGKVHFDPRKFCTPNCYCGFALDSQLGKDWLQGANLNWETGDIDLEIRKTLLSRYNEVKDEIVSNMSLFVDANGPSGFKIKAKVRYSWPRLSTQKTVVFPLTALGNESHVDIMVSNPSNVPVIFQAALAHTYGPSWTHFFQEPPLIENLTEGNFVFSIKDVLLSSSSHSNDSGNLGDIKHKLKRYLPEQKRPLPGMFFSLPPTSKASLSLRFTPLSREMSNTVLLLRNNLTGIESISLKGRAGTGQLTVGNGVSGSSLLFQITEKLLQGCDRSDQSAKHVSPQVTVRRSFIARNVGEIPLEIITSEVYPRQGSLWTWIFGGSLETENDRCEGYGFRILNCHPFIVQPNQTHSVDIAFTPDFTLSKVKAVLHLTDSTGGHFNYTLIALIPSSMLTKCSGMLARPWWEWYFKIVAIVGTVIIFVAACFMLYFEASGVISKSVLATVRIIPRSSVPDSHQEEQTQRLDLKAVYDKVENRFKKNECQRGQANGSCNNVLSPKPHQQPKCEQQQQQQQQQQQNSNLRNRKSKKGSTEFSPPHQQHQHNNISSNNNKLAEKRTQNNSFTRSPNIPIGATVEEVVATYMKKDKENIVNNNNNKKKKGNVKGKKLNCTSLQNKKMEEETSSTTTESSNPDEIVPEPYEKKSIGKGLKSNIEQIKTNGAKKEKKTDSSDENIPASVAQALPPKPVEDKKRSQKDKNADMLNIDCKGSVSPKFEKSLWDTPRPPSGEGFSEFTSQTEAFGMQRSVKRNLSGNDAHGMVGNNLDRHFGIGNIGEIPPYQYQPFQQQHQQVPVKPKKPGVIGQPRSTPPVPNSQGNYGSHSHSVSPPLPPNVGYAGYNNNIGHIIPRQHLGSATGAIWDTEILPDNGCDVWGRRGGYDNSNAAPGYYNKNSAQFGHGTKVGYGPGLQQNGFDAPPPPTTANALGFPTTNAESQYSYAPTRHSNMNNFSTPLPRNIAPGFEPRAGETSYLYGRLTNDLNNPWNPEPSQYRSSQKPCYVNGQQQQTTTSSPNTHGYLQRMRSDPTIRSDPNIRQQQQPTPTSKNSGGSWVADTERQQENNRKPWLSSSPSSGLSSTPVPASLETSFNEWRSIGPPGSITSSDTQIWDTNVVGGERWPSYNNSSTINTTTTDSVIGSRSRIRSEDSTTTPVPSSSLAEITREVEAGLGFNPFTSDIWNHTETSSSSSSWGNSSFKFSSTKK